MRDSSKSAAMKAGTIIVAVMIVSVPVIGLWGYEQVPEGYQGVEKEWGEVTGNRLDSGAHWKVPIMEGVQNVETRPRTYTMSNSQGEGAKSRADAITVITVNGTSVDVDVTVRYRIQEGKVDQFVSEWNNERQMERRLIRPTVRSDLRDEGSDIQTSDIYTREGRERLAETARESLAEEFSDEPVTLEAVQVRDTDLPDKIDQVLDQKEQAKQQVQVEQQKVEQERQRAKQRQIEAEADAEVIQTKGEALRENPIVLRERYIAAIDDTDKVIVGGGGNSTAGGIIIGGSGGN